VSVFESELEKLNNSKDLVEVKLIEKAKLSGKVLHTVGELYEKARTLKGARTVLQSWVTKLQVVVEKHIKYISAKESVITEMKARTMELEKKHQVLIHEISSQRSKLEARIFELEQHLNNQNWEKHRNEGREAELDILHTTESTLLQAQTEIASLRARLGSEQLGRKTIEEDHQAAIYGYEEMIIMKNEIIRNLKLELSAFKG